MPEFIYKKLVRDNIPGWHEEAGHVVDVRTLRGLDLKRALIQKIHEEADEIPLEDDATPEVVEELADVVQVIQDLMVAYGVTPDEVEAVRLAKAGKKGGFSEGQYVRSVYMPTDDKWVQYCRQAPDKYPETPS